LGISHVFPFFLSVAGAPQKEGNLKRLVQLTFRSAERMLEGEEKLEETGDPVWKGFLKRESNILLARAFKFWFKIRFWK